MSSFFDDNVTTLCATVTALSPAAGFFPAPEQWIRDLTYILTDYRIVRLSRSWLMGRPWFMSNPLNVQWTEHAPILEHAGSLSSHIYANTAHLVIHEHWGYIGRALPSPFVGPGFNPRAMHRLEDLWDFCGKGSGSRIPPNSFHCVPWDSLAREIPPIPDHVQLAWIP